MPLPQDNPALQAHYRERQSSLNREQQAVVARRLRFRLFLALCFALTVYLGTRPPSHFAPNWLVMVPILTMLASIPTYLRFQSEIIRIQRLQVFYDTNLSRVDGSKPQSGLTGEEFHTPSHLYDRDLNILGPDSLFGLLATVRTGIGQRGLARLLLEPATSQQSRERQRSIQELTPLTALREQIALLGPSRFEEIPASLFDTWLDDPPPTFHPAVTWTLVLTSTTIIILLLTGLFHYATWSALLPNLAAVFALQTAVALLVRRRVLPILNASNVARQMQLFADGLALLQQQSFNAPQLRSIS